MATFPIDTRISVGDVVLFSDGQLWSKAAFVLRVGEIKKAPPKLDLLVPILLPDGSYVISEVNKVPYNDIAGNMWWEPYSRVE